MGCSNNTVIGIFIYLHHLFALDCMDIVGEILSWSLVGISGNFSQLPRAGILRANSFASTK